MGRRMDGLSILRAIAALAATLGLIFVAAAILRRSNLSFAPKPLPGRSITVQESFHLDPRRRLVVVRWSGEDHLIMLGATTETVIARRAPTAETAPTPSEPAP